MPLLTTDMNIAGALKKVNLIPERNFTASSLLQITYPGDKEVLLGNTLTPSDAAEQPTVTFVPPEESAAYTIVMTDPDAPSATDHKFGPWRHWIAVNVPGNDPSNVAQHHTPYIGPGPGPGTGVHRYLFLLYKQAQPNSTFAPMAHEEKPDRRNFDLKHFVTENQLELVAANFFLCSAP
ncbi:phosphatidylethanolamine-binding protein [Zychaea mexicana]|uniref:phosphatidylethanolamine-binding protein n=1 Tax=Zychaea mexicana TaxID=64656 RepID=UPI0022FE8638|nr:phosphatidylethanolamine-binding protein [Zychaea mexicana]KAI9492563.1 phosphatidylethanolamine-binding protein [Zychaea mexicana]